MGIVIVDGQEIEIGDRDRLNGIQVARARRRRDSALLLASGADGRGQLPHVPGRNRHAECRDRRDHDAAQARAGLPDAGQRQHGVRHQQREGAKKPGDRSKKTLLIDHPIDCPICDKAGECHLQDYHFEHGQAQRRADIQPFTSRRRDMGDTVTLFVDRCVMCSRCVRFCREITGTRELMVINRGSHEEIDVFPGYPLANKMSGNVVDLCPVGALGDKDFLYKQRVWFMKRHPGVCAGCSTGCSIRIDENQDTVYRLTPRGKSVRQQMVDVRRRPLRLSSFAQAGAANRTEAVRTGRRDGNRRRPRHRA